ncbi:RNA-directed DNA polymerase, eukaryota, reverse transcriptase zinc-binding domain protein [Tanacetum coccineum]|uniref:RNA-directed DNA polymerase, eukaryota, reverse transcriptase zinc-binding domain protein n=1 Tax=Tanacetum coccineum TaxID=301880 RepID=A0ABQ5BG33_9ASTR
MQDTLLWGSLTLIKSVLSGIGTYYFSSFKVPTTIINKLESICRNFFWARNSDERKMAWIAWDKVIALLDQGGLNIGGLKKDDLLSYGITLPSLFKRKTGNGLTTKFWLDSWIGGPPICNSFPRLFRLERNTNCLVHDRVPQPTANRPLSAASVPGGSHRLNPSASRPQLIHNCPLPMGLCFTWDWIRPLCSAAEQQELQELCSLISKLCLSNDQYIWKCTISDDRRFTVKSMRTYINILLHPLEPQPFKWNKILPIKINISSWRIFHKRLPTRCSLDRRGIDLNSTHCSACGEYIETEEHLFNSCRIAKHTWSKVLIWWKINNVSISSLLDAINLAERVSIPGNLKAYFDVVVQTTLWFLWRFRNEMCFSLKQPSKDLILNEIKLSSFNWISSPSVLLDVSRSKIVATGSVFIEKKFVRSCGKAGHIEDVVVDSSARGMQLGKKVIGFLADHARLMGCYKVILDCSAVDVGGGFSIVDVGGDLAGGKIERFDEVV